MTSSVVNDTRIEHEHRRRVDRPWKRNDETAITVDDDWREIGIVNGYGKERISRGTRDRRRGREPAGKRYTNRSRTCVCQREESREEKSACEQVHVKDVQRPSR